jgi:putative cardiolipin synthase
MVSPYFVPNGYAVTSLGRARAAGLGVDLITNSLASTDEPWVYVGYEAHIKALLKVGVKMWELSPSLRDKRHKLGVFGDLTSAMHMKSAIVDHKQVFLGSMNFDQRSAKLYAELGLIIESQEMARQLESFADAGSAYKLRLSADGDNVEWIENPDDSSDGKEIVYDVPPETTMWQHFWLRLVGPFIPEKEL